MEMTGPMTKPQLVIVAVFSAVALALALTTFVAPAWGTFALVDVLDKTKPHGSISYGVFLITLCLPGGDCETHSYPYYWDLKSSYFEGTKAWMASNMAKAIVAIVILGVTLGLEIRALCSDTWRVSSATFCVVAGCIAVTLQWQVLVSQIIETTLLPPTTEPLALNIRQELRGVAVFWRFPWCLPVHGVATLVTTATTIYFIVMFVKSARSHVLSNNSETDQQEMANRNVRPNSSLQHHFIVPQTATRPLPTRTAYYNVKRHSSRPVHQNHAQHWSRY